MRVLLALGVALALSGCSSAYVVPQRPVTEREYVAYLEREGIVPKYGDAKTAVTLGHQICDRYDRGDSFAAVIATLTHNGIPNYEAGQISGAATAAFCPQHHTP